MAVQRALAAPMGSCVSKPNKKLKSKAKHIYRSCKIRRKVPRSSVIAPLDHRQDGEACLDELSFQEFVMVGIPSCDAAVSARHEVQGLEFQFSEVERNTNQAAASSEFLYDNANFLTF